MISRRALLLGAGAVAGSAILPAPARASLSRETIFRIGTGTTIGLLEPDNGIRWLGQWGRILSDEEVRAMFRFLRAKLDEIERDQAEAMAERLADSGFVNRLENASLQVIE